MPESEPVKEFESFRTFVIDNRSVQAKLVAIENMEDFLLQVVQTGEAHGFHFEQDTVVAALRANRRAWIERWIR